jgi:Ni,Fe-hydrogenase III small subunit
MFLSGSSGVHIKYIDKIPVNANVPVEVKVEGNPPENMMASINSVMVESKIE